MSKLGAFDQSALGAYIESKLSMRGSFESVVFSARWSRQRLFLAGACASSYVGWYWQVELFAHGDLRSELTYSPGTYHYGEAWNGAEKIVLLTGNSAIAGVSFYPCPFACSVVAFAPGIVPTPNGYTKFFISGTSSSPTPEPFKYWDEITTFKVIHRVTGLVIKEWTIPPLNYASITYCPLFPSIILAQDDIYQV